MKIISSMQCVPLSNIQGPSRDFDHHTSRSENQNLLRSVFLWSSRKRYDVPKATSRMKTCTHKFEKVSLAPHYFHRKSRLTMHLSAILVRSIEEYRGIHKVNLTYSPLRGRVMDDSSAWKGNIRAWEEKSHSNGRDIIWDVMFMCTWSRNSSRCTRQINCLLAFLWNR